MGMGNRREGEALDGFVLDEIVDFCAVGEKAGAVEGHQRGEVLERGVTPAAGDNKGAALSDEGLDGLPIFGGNTDVVMAVGRGTG